MFSWDVCRGSIGLFVRVIGTAYEWARFDVPEAHLLTLGFECGEFFQWDITLNGKMLERWAKILPDGEYIDLVRAHIMHDFDNLIPCLAQSQHEAGLGWRGGIHFFGPLEHLERTLVDGLRAHALVQPGNGFDVMIENIGPGIDHDLQRVIDTLEIGRQYFDFTIGVETANPTDSSGENGSAAIFEFVTVDRGDHSMAQGHLLHRFGDTFRFLPVKANWATGLYSAKAAAACADAPQYHECGGFVAPAFADIWAARLFTYGVQFFAAHQLLQIVVVFALWRAHLEPFRSPLRYDGRHSVFLRFIPRATARVAHTIRARLSNTRRFRVHSFAAWCARPARSRLRPRRRGCDGRTRGTGTSCNVRRWHRPQ